MDTPDDDADRTTARILDAAEVVFAKFGLKRTNVEDIGVEAGLHRGTVYRKFGNKDQLFKATLLRNGQRMLEQAAARAASERSGVDRLAEGFVSCIMFVREDPLLTGLMSTEPDLLYPFLTAQGTSLVDFGRVFLADRIRGLQESGEIAGEVDADSAAEVAMRLAQSIVLTPNVHIPLNTEQEIRNFARDWLFPVALHVHNPPPLAGSPEGLPTSSTEGKNS